MSTIEMPPAPPYPSQPPVPAPQKKKSGFRKFVMWMLVLAVLGVFGVIGFMLWTDSKIDRIEDLESLQPVAGERNILVVGTDSRENLPDDFEGNFGDFAGARTDVIMVAHVADGRAQLLSLPRDLKVDIPGHGTGKINAAYVYGGPDLLIETVNDNLGIPINNYVEIDFFGFANVVDALGGVTMTFDYPVRDVKSGLELDAGTHNLTGPEALAFARSRSFQEYRDGSWVNVDADDIGRTGRQQQLLLTMMSEATSPGNAFNLPGFTSAFAEQIRADTGLSVAVMADLGRSALGLSGDRIDAVTLPVVFSNEGGVSYVVPDQPAASAVIDDFLAGNPLEN